MSETRKEVLRGRAKYVELYTKHRGAPSVSERKVIEHAFEAGAQWGAVAMVSEIVEHDANPSVAARRIIEACS